MGERLDRSLGSPLIERARRVGSRSETPEPPSLQSPQGAATSKASELLQRSLADLAEARARRQRRQGDGRPD
jgi:hypothetical protein